MGVLRTALAIALGCGCGAGDGESAGDAAFSDAVIPTQDAARTDGGEVDATRSDAVVVPVPGMVHIDPSTFWMGCNDEVDPCFLDTLPYHMVALSAYDIDQREVTQTEYASCVAAGSCAAPAATGSCAGTYDPAVTPQWPVTCITWEDAVAYCGFTGKRLPTEAEWERAARGTDGRFYPWGDAPPSCELVNYDGAFGCDGELHDVGSHPAGRSPEELDDMAGNAAEWVTDWYDSTYYQRSPETDPQGPETGAHHVTRGGHAESTLPRSVRVYTRGTGIATPLVGFRCAR